MLSAQELASLVSQHVTLRKIGQDRWQGLCPFHDEKTSSFQVWRGRRHEGRYHCHGCGADGDAIDWLRIIEKKSWNEAGGTKPDPELAQQRQQERVLEEIWQGFLNDNPDLPPEARSYLEIDGLMILQHKLRQHLQRGA